MPQYARPAAQRQAERARRASRNSYINNFQDPETLVRWLWEDPARVWQPFYYHFHYAKKISYPCMRGQKADDGTVINYCIGCTWPADETLDDEARKKDPNWRVRRPNYGIAAPALTIKTVDGELKEYLDIYQIGVTLYDSIKTLYREDGTVTARDMKINRNDDGKTSYMPTYPQSSEIKPRKYVVELRELLRECAPGMTAEEGTPEYEAGWARWRAGNIELGIPDVNQILDRKYAEAVAAYGLTADDIAARNAEMTKGTTATIGGLKAAAHAAKATVPDTPAAPTPAAMDPAEMTLDQLPGMTMPVLLVLAKNDIDTAGKLLAWSAQSLLEVGVKPEQVTVVRLALANVGLELADEPGSPVAATDIVAAQLTSAPAPAQQEATVHHLPAAAGAQLAGAQAAAEAGPPHTNGTTALHPDGSPNFAAWDTADVRDYLLERKTEIGVEKDFLDKAPRSVLVAMASKHVVGF